MAGGGHVVTGGVCGWWSACSDGRCVWQVECMYRVVGEVRTEFFEYSRQARVVVKDSKNSCRHREE